MSKALTALLKFLAIFLLSTAMVIACNLAVAQIAIMGLAKYHVSSGIVGPFALAIAAEMVIGAGVGTTTRNRKS